MNEQRGFPRFVARTEVGADRCRAAFTGRSAGRRGFSLLDLLVSIAVIAVLMGIMAPVLSKVTDATHRVLCQSNIRELGLALALYADDNNDRLPPSVFCEVVERGQYQPQEMQLVRVGGDSGDWDGLGWLFEQEYAQSPEVFYCPAHKGEHPLSALDGVWYTWGVAVMSNYHFRAVPSHQAFLHELDPRTALVADGMRSESDYNHEVGANVLRADMSIEWFPDRAGLLGDLLPQTVGAPQADSSVDAAWWLLERGALNDYPGLPWNPGGPDTLPGFQADLSL